MQEKRDYITGFGKPVLHTWGIGYRFFCCAQHNLTGAVRPLLRAAGKNMEQEKR
jgi:hypothetical protein